MQLFSGIDYIKIDLADSFGLDKQNFADRINWVNNNFTNNSVKGLGSKELLNQLRQVNLNTGVECENEPKALASLISWRDYLDNKPSGYMSGKDGSSSGMQILSALAKCAVGLFNTGLLGFEDSSKNNRMDVYSTAYKRYIDITGSNHIIERGDIKKCLMTSFYGSRKTPRTILGEEGLIPFRQVCEEVLPGAFSVKESLIEHWNSNTDVHQWVNADGFLSYIPVLVQNKYNINVGGLDIKFTLTERGKLDSSLSNAA